MERNVAEMGERIGSDERDEVELAGRHAEPFHPRQRAQLLAQVAPQTLPHVDQHQRRHGQADRGRVDTSGEPGDDPALDEPIEAVVGRRPTDADLRGERRCRHPAVGAEQVDHPLIHVIEFDHEMIVPVCANPAI